MFAALFLWEANLSEAIFEPESEVHAFAFAKLRFVFPTA